MYKTEMRTSSQKILIIVEILTMSISMGKELVMSWTNKDEAESVLKPAEIGKNIILAAASAY